MVMLLLFGFLFFSCVAIYVPFDALHQSLTCAYSDWAVLQQIHSREANQQKQQQTAPASDESSGQAYPCQKRQREEARQALPPHPERHLQLSREAQGLQGFLLPHHCVSHFSSNSSLV